MYLILLIVIASYWYGVRNFGYWKKRNIKHDYPLPYFGNNLKQYLQKASMGMMATETYRKYPKEKVVGFYRSSCPELLIRDPEIVKRILITDFYNFHDRGFNPHKKVIEPMLRNLFFVDGDTWRLLRQRITPAFSTGKLRAMFPHITDRAEKLQVLANKIAERREVCDLKELMARYTTDFIGVCGFGLNMDSISEEESEFRKLGKRIFYRSPSDAVRAVLKLMFPELFKYLTSLSPEIETSMVHLVNTVVKQRNNKPSGKNDFIDLMLELKQNGMMVGESIEQRNPDGSPKLVEIELDDLLMTAQVFVFFGAGFETSSSASSYALHQLAFNQDCQEKVHKEIDKVLAEYGNKITYEAVKEMKYLKMAFYEGMRMYPSVGFLMRECVSPEYTIPEVGITINKGVKVIIPIQAMHNDEKYFVNPKKFDPERFNPESIHTLNKFVYLPFGDGPRSCIGSRLGEMQSMAGLVSILQKFSLEPAATSLKEPIPDPTGIVSESIIGGLPVLLKQRNKYYVL